MENNLELVEIEIGCVVSTEYDLNFLAGESFIRLEKRIIKRN